jgi:hypothetical protein
MPVPDTKDFQRWKQHAVKDAAALMKVGISRFASTARGVEASGWSTADSNDAALIGRVGLMTTGYDKRDDGPSPKVFVLAVGAVLILLVYGFYILSR